MQQLSLFSEPTEERHPWEYIPDFLSRSESDVLHLHCKKLNWQQYKSAGLFSPSNPRLECLYGRGAHKEIQANPWTKELDSLCRRIEQYSGYRFDYVAANLYRGGDDCMDWHSDSAPSLGNLPAICSVSLGQNRLFQVKNKATQEKKSLWLEHGSLLIMAPGMQSTHQHRIPRVTRGWCGERINLTFRPHHEKVN
jgi:alkylated DNA repair dioxygenase AlkB